VKTANARCADVVFAAMGVYCDCSGLIQLSALLEFSGMRSS
jgi:hypothetical protein